MSLGLITFFVIVVFLGGSLMTLKVISKPKKSKKVNDNAPK